jgi:hypothetical protein
MLPERWATQAQSTEPLVCYCSYCWLKTYFVTVISYCQFLKLILMIMLNWFLLLAHLSKGNMSYCHHLGNFIQNLPYVASYQVLIHLAKQFQRRRFFLEIDQSETKIVYGGHVHLDRLYYPYFIVHWFQKKKMSTTMLVWLHVFRSTEQISRFPDISKQVISWLRLDLVVTGVYILNATN